MANSSTRGTKVTIDELVLDAWIFAGILDVGTLTTDPSVAGKLAFGRRMLDRILDELSNVADARAVDFHDLAMVASQQTYTLPEEIVSVIDRAIYIPASESSTETYATSTPVKPVTADFWHMLTAKDSTGTPTLFYAHRGKEDVYTIEVRVWPMPDEAGTLKLRVQRAPADSLVGSDTLDVKSALNGYLLHELAARLVFGTNPTKARELRQVAMLMKRDARTFAAEHGDSRLVFAGRPAQRRGT